METSFGRPSTSGAMTRSARSFNASRLALAYTQSSRTTTVGTTPRSCTFSVQLRMTSCWSRSIRSTDTTLVGPSGELNRTLVECKHRSKTAALLS